jgi:uncharacterized protein YecE (DUF72 family)
LIRVGSAGWSYPDWDGLVYPARSGKGFDPLAYLARFVDCIEINSTFYRIPQPSAAASWAERIADRADFRFTAKLWRGFTHEPILPEEARSAESSFRSAMEPLRSAGKLSAILIQFPYSVHDTLENRDRLAEILDRFSDFPLVVEVRHASWMKDDYLAWLKERSVGFCNVDQPAISANIGPTDHVTAPVAYVRLHGRNVEAWFDDGAGRDRRYDYLYTAEELAPWVDRIISMSLATDVFVIANNHYRGQGVANAVEIKSLLMGANVAAPRALLETYPRLKSRATGVETERGRRRSPAQGVLPLS